MKRSLIVVVALAVPAAIVGAGLLGSRALRLAEADERCPPQMLTKAGTCRLHGKVKVVDSFPKYKVKVVDSFPDIKVQKVASFPDSPGKWQFVDSFPDFTIQYVDSFPDFTVKFVDSFPGCD